MADAFRLNADAQRNLVQLCKKILENHQSESEVYTKFEFIDVAYARYKQYQQAGANGEDLLRAELEATGINLDEITIPIVVSQVDSYVGYFSDVFLSGYPIFPVVSSVNTKNEAEALESIIDTHATQGRYARHMLMSFYDTAKYNISAIEVDWSPMNDYQILSDYQQLKTQKKLQPSAAHFNKIKRIDPYNLIMDRNVLPVDVPYHGEFAGYVEILSHVELRKKLAYYEKSLNGYNTSQAIFSGLGKGTIAPTTLGYYRDPPQISDFISKRPVKRGMVLDWDSYLTGKRTLKSIHNAYEHVVLYVRLVPDMFGMTNVPSKGTPQVWKLCFINHDKLVYAARQYSVYDTIPMYIGQPFEDGFGMQSQSIAESAVVFQEGASKLFSIRLNAARRSVMDRAIYDPQMLNPSHIDTPYPAPKIPLRDSSTISGKKISDAYAQIPFDSRGTETVIQDMASLIGMADRMNGINQPMQGQFQKGNKSRKEWEDTMAGAANRLRLRALALEMQQILSIKEQIKFNIFQHGVAGSFQSITNGRAYDINGEMLQRIKDKIGSFQIADGLIPADKLASTEMIQLGLQTISNSPILQQAWGPALPKMFAHMLSLGGVKGLDQYLPEQPPMQAQQAAALPPGQGEVEDNDADDAAQGMQP